MDAKLQISERIQDLRKERGLTLEQLAEQTGLSRAALGNYEGDDSKDISIYAVTKLAQFYGATTDYLLALSEQKNHPDVEVTDLHLSDEMIDILLSGKLNNRLLCEIVTHSEFHRLLLDIEIYVDRIAGMQIDNLNAMVATARAEILAKGIRKKNCKFSVPWNLHTSRRTIFSLMSYMKISTPSFVTYGKRTKRI